MGVWIGSSLMASDAGHVLMCLLAVSLSSPVRFLFVSFARFTIGLFVSLLLSGMRPLWILDTSPLSERSCASICSRSVGCLLLLWTASFAVQERSIWVKSQHFVVAFVSLALADVSCETLLWPS